MAAATQSPPPTTSRTTAPKIQEVLGEVGYGTGVSPTFQSFGERIPSYLDIGRRINKMGAGGTSSFTNSWMQPEASYQFDDGKPKSLIGKLNPLNYISGSNALFAVGKPLSAVAAFVDVTADVVRETWRDGDMNPFDKEAWSLDALGREWERTQNSLTDWNRQVGTGLGDSEWNQIYTFGEVLRDQNWLQGDVFGWESSELTVIPDWVPVLPEWKQRVSPSGLVGTFLNVWADPLTGIRNVGKGVELAQSLSAAKNSAQQAVARHAYRNAYLGVLTKEGIDITDDVVRSTVDDLVEQSQQAFFGYRWCGKKHH